MLSTTVEGTGGHGSPAEETTMESPYSVDDGDGNEITTGLQEHNARRVAQNIATSRGETVYLYGPDAEPEKIDPADAGCAR